MAYEVKIGERVAQVEIHNKSGNTVLIEIDGTQYEADIVQVEKGIYSLLIDGKSYNVELVESGNGKNYLANTFLSTVELEIIDAETKYLKSRDKGIAEIAEKMIVAPMPGKVMKILVAPGEDVVAGQTVIIVEAMKMQNEYTAKKDTRVKEILVKEGDTINSNQHLVIFE